MTEPAQASLRKNGKHAWHACLGQDSRVCDPILPGDAQETSEVAHVEGIQSLLLVRVQGPGLATIEKSAQYAGLVDPHLGVNCKLGVVPHPLRQAGHGVGCFAHVERQVTGVWSTMAIAGVVLTSWPMMLVLFRLMVRANSSHAFAKRVESR